MQRVALVSVKTLLLLSALPLGAFRADGQSSDSIVVSVLVADRLTARPIAAVRVEFLEAKASGMTDSTGEAYFRLSSGLVRIRAYKAGYQRADRTIVVGLAEALDITIALKRTDRRTELDTVRVRASRPPEYLDEFERRRALGLGKFVTTAELDSSKHERFADFAARKLTGLRAEWSNPPVTAKLFSLRGYVRFTLGKERCSATVYVDNVRIDEFDLASLVTGDIAGVEYYPTSPPVQYTKAGMLCGAVLIWMKQ